MVRLIFSFLLFTFAVLMIEGCVFRNDRGFSTKYYNKCVEYYDAQGIYHKKCDPNFLNDEDVSAFYDEKVKPLYSAPQPEKPQGRPKVIAPRHDD